MFHRRLDQEGTDFSNQTDRQYGPFSPLFERSLQQSFLWFVKPRKRRERPRSIIKRTMAYWDDCSNCSYTLRLQIPSILCFLSLVSMLREIDSRTSILKLKDVDSLHEKWMARLEHHMMTILLNSHCPSSMIVMTKNWSRIQRSWISHGPASQTFPSSSAYKYGTCRFLIAVCSVWLLLRMTKTLNTLEYLDQSYSQRYSIYVTSLENSPKPFTVLASRLWRPTKIETGGLHPEMFYTSRTGSLLWIGTWGSRSISRRVSWIPI